MVVTGAQPVQRQLVKFEAKGVLQIEPEAVQKDHARARRTGSSCSRAAATGLERWRPAARSRGRGDPSRYRGEDAAPIGPVREIAAEELSGVDTRPFRPRRAGGRGDARRGRRQRPLTVRFGALNPEGFLQYMRIDGDPKVYLMSRFIGAEWAAALEGVKAR